MTLSQPEILLLSLMSAALRGCAPAPAAPSEADLRAAYKLARKNSVDSLTWPAMEAAREAGVAVPDDLFSDWRDSSNRALLRYASFQMEREAVLADARACGLAALPLKGVVMAPLYPRPEMRSMCDNDVLYGFVEPAPEGGYRVRGDAPEEQAATIERASSQMACIMEARGYRCEGLGRGNADCFHKEPFYNFEMHRMLAEPTLSWAVYYRNPWKRAVPLSDDSLSFRFSHEDEYVFHIAHTFKHFDSAGCGVRCIADEWVLLHAYGEQLNWDYIDEQLRALNMEGFERTLRDLAIALVDRDAAARMLAGKSDALSPAQLGVLAYLLGNGTYGTFSNRVSRDIAQKRGGSRFKYVASRLFPSRSSLEVGYPVLKKHPWAMPFVWAYRLTVKGWRGRKRIAAELSYVRKQDDRGGERHDE